MRDMHKVYEKLSMQALQVRRSRCVIELERAEKGKSLWNDRDVRELKHIIHQIDVEINCRILQQPLF